MKSKIKSKSKSKSTVKKTTVKANLVRTNINIDKELHGKAKKLSFKENISLNKFINNALRAYVK